MPCPMSLPMTPFLRVPLQPFNVSASAFGFQNLQSLFTDSARTFVAPTATIDPSWDFSALESYTAEEKGKIEKSIAARIAEEHKKDIETKERLKVLGSASKRKNDRIKKAKERAEAHSDKQRHTILSKKERSKKKSTLRKSF